MLRDHSRSWRGLSHAALADVFAAQDHHKENEGLVLPVHTTSVADLRQQGPRSCKCDVFWRGTGFGDRLSAM
jgi:hypothetical protein